MLVCSAEMLSKGPSRNCTNRVPEKSSAPVTSSVALREREIFMIASIAEGVSPKLNALSLIYNHEFRPVRMAAT